MAESGTGADAYRGHCRPIGERTLAFIDRVQGTVPDDARAVVLELTDVGRALLRGVVAAITAHLGELRPVMISLSLALSGHRQGLGAPAR